MSGRLLRGFTPRSDIPLKVLDGFSITNGNDWYGGGIFCSGASPTIRDCIISGNFANLGGGIRCSSSSAPMIANCTISGNSASQGGGISSTSSSPTITNSIFWGDSAPESPEIHIYSGSPVVTFSDVQGGWPEEGNIQTDPLFTGGGDYHLSTDSPCIDAGIDAAVYEDIDGKYRPHG